MLNKTNFKLGKFHTGFFGVWAILLLTRVEVYAQSKIPAQQTDIFSWWNICLFLMVISLAAAIYYKFKSKEPKEISANGSGQSGNSSKFSGNGSAGNDKELEWLRNNRKVGNSPTNGGSAQVEAERRKGGLSRTPDDLSLPIFSFSVLKRTRPIDNLPISNDDALMCAIEQVHDEFEEDEEVRALAVRILAAFKTGNSVEALSQVALYDLSANLRSSALTVLAEFDHPSVFETVLLTCADPTREVRAAAARALFHLTFNRAEAWVRITESEDSGKMLQAARAAIEGGLVERSFERLAHADGKYAYEAFALVRLLIKAGEVQPIFEAFKKHKESKVKRAILHTVKVSKDKKALEGLYEMLKDKTLAPEFQELVDKTIEEMGFVTV